MNELAFNVKPTNRTYEDGTSEKLEKCGGERGSTATPGLVYRCSEIKEKRTQNITDD